MQICECTDDKANYSVNAEERSLSDQVFRAGITT